MCPGLQLLEEFRLRWGIFWVAKVLQADTYEPEALLRPQVDTFQKSDRDIGQLFAGGWRLDRRKAAREDVEFPRLQLEYHSSRDAGLLARCRPHFLSQTTDHWLGFHQWNIFLKRVLGRDRFRRPV